MNENDDDKAPGLQRGPVQIMSPLMSPKMSAFYDVNAPSFMSSSPRMNFKKAPDPSSAASESSASTSLPLSKRPRISKTPKLATISTSLPYQTTTEDTDISLFDDDSEGSPDDDDFLDGFELGNDNDDDDDDVSDDDETRHNDVSSDDGSGDNDGDNEDDEDDTKKLKIINRMLRKLTSVNNDKDVNMKSPSSSSSNGNASDDDVTDDDSDDCESVLRMPLPSPYRVPIVCDPPPPTPPPSRLGTVDESDAMFSLYGGPSMSGGSGNNTPRVLEFLSPSFLNCEGTNSQSSMMVRNNNGNGGRDGLEDDEEEDVEIKMPVAMGSMDGKRTPSLYELSHSNITCNNSNVNEYINDFNNQPSRTPNIFMNHSFHPNPSTTPNNLNNNRYNNDYDDDDDDDDNYEYNDYDDNDNNNSDKNDDNDDDDIDTKINLYEDPNIQRPKPNHPTTAITTVTTNNNINSNNTSITCDSDNDDDDTYTYKFEVAETDPYPFIHRLVKSFRPQSIRRNILGAKPPNTPKVTLVLDLDETLVHCTTDRNDSADVSFSLFFNNQTYYVSAMKRPFLEEFMEEVTSMFEVVIFTASQQIYADRLLNILDPSAKWSKLRLFRDSCAFVEGNYIKDLSVLGRDLSHVIIIDNSPQAFAFHYNNALPISSWFDSDSDTELIKILPLLKKLSKLDDVRPILRERFKLYERIE